MPHLLLQDTRTSTSASVVSSSSAGMQRGGRSRSGTLRLGRCRVVRLWAECAAFLFCVDWSDRSVTGLTGGVGRQCRPVRPVGRTGLTGLDKSELMTASVVVGSVLFKLQSSIVKEVCKLFVYI